MTRRNRDKSFKDRKKKEKSSRRGGSLPQKSLVIIACEGEKTEHYYFKSLFSQLQQGQNLSKASCVIAKHDHTNPTGVLQDLISYRDISTGRTYTTFEHKWIVIDRDEERVNGGGHTPQDFNNALIQAKTRGVEVAYSNPCFELWYLLHFDYVSTPLTRDIASSRLKNKLAGEYKKNDPKMYDKLEGKLGLAIKNSEKLWEQMQETGQAPISANPSTAVFKLLCTLLCSAKNKIASSTCALTKKSCTQPYKS